MRDPREIAGVQLATSVWMLPHQPVHAASDVARDPKTVLTNAAAAAVLAPSTYNTQPWKLRIAGDVLELHADRTRHLPVIDGDLRQLVQSCGCALFNARVAVRAMGYRDEVTMMVTSAVDRDLLATLHLGAPMITSNVDHELVHAIASRRTNRRAFQARPVGMDAAARLINAAAREGAWMIRLEPDEKYALGRIVDEADQLQYGDPGFRAELARWLRPTGSLRRDGIPFGEKEYGSAMPFSVMRSLRSPSLASTFGAIEESRIDSAPFVAVIGTYRDDPIDWLAAGQALEAVLLHATSFGMSAAFLNQALEIPAMRARVAELAGSAGFPHMVLRIGYPSAPVEHPAPRRALDDVLHVIA